MAASDFVTEAQVNALVTAILAEANDVAAKADAAYKPAGTDVPVTDGGTGASDASGARTNLGLVIGTNVQAFAANNALLSNRLDQFAIPTATLNLNNQALNNVADVKMRVQTVSGTGAITLNTALYNVFNVTMTGNRTFTFSGSAANVMTAFRLVLRGAFTPTFPASVDWGDAAAPTYTTPSVYDFWTVNNGTDWFATQIGKAFG